YFPRLQPRQLPNPILYCFPFPFTPETAFTNRLGNFFGINTILAPIFLGKLSSRVRARTRHLCLHSKTKKLPRPNRVLGRTKIPKGVLEIIPRLRFVLWITKRIINFPYSIQGLR